MTIKIYNIDWDTSDFSEEEELASGVCVPDLPHETELEVDPISFMDSEPSEFIAEALTDIYEYAVLGFNYEIV